MAASNNTRIHQPPWFALVEVLSIGSNSLLVAVINNDCELMEGLFIM